MLVGEMFSALALGIGEVASLLVRGVFGLVIAALDVLAACMCCCRVPFRDRPDRDGYTYASARTPVVMSKYQDGAAPASDAAATKDKRTFRKMDTRKFSKTSFGAPMQMFVKPRLFKKGSSQQEAASADDTPAAEGEADSSAPAQAGEDRRSKIKSMLFTKKTKSTITASGAPAEENKPAEEPKAAEEPQAQTEAQASPFNFITVFFGGKSTAAPEQEQQKKEAEAAQSSAAESSAAEGSAAAAETPEPAAEESKPEESQPQNEQETEEANAAGKKAEESKSEEKLEETKSVPNGLVKKLSKKLRA